MRRLYQSLSPRSLFVQLRSAAVTLNLILAILVGVAAGLGAVVFRWLIGSFSFLFFEFGGVALSFLNQYYVVLVPAVGGLLVGLLVYFWAREARGHGVPEVMAAVAAKGGRIRPRVAVVKTLASSICIGSGGSVGREGPIVQIGSSVGSSIGQWLRLPEESVKTLVACGAAGGISATFNAPIAGALFALEVILGRVVSRQFGFVVVASVVADIVGQMFLGPQRSFVLPQWSLVSPWEIVFYAVLGMVAPFVALGFTVLLYRCEDLAERLRLPEYLKPALGGIAIGLIGLYSADLFGVGYQGIEKALTGQVALLMLLSLLVLKIVATSVTLGSGGSGGIFAPSLFMGAMLGVSFGQVVHAWFPAITGSPGGYGIVGMGAVFAGAARAPLTAIIILFEMTGDYGLILPLMTSVVLSTLIADGLKRENIYSIKLRRQGIDLRRREFTDLMSFITVGEVMTRGFPTVPPTMPLTDLTDKLVKTGYHGFPVVNERGEFCGVVALADVERTVGREANSLTVGDIATKSPIVAYSDQSLAEVLALIGDLNIGRIPVVDRHNPRRLIGVLRRHDIVRAYRRAVTRQLGRR